MWDYETIDNADITEDSSVFEMEPLTEIRVGSNVSIKSLVRSADPDTPTLWYAQDANGAIWKVDVIVSHTVSGHTSPCVMHAHAPYLSCAPLCCVAVLPALSPTEAVPREDDAIPLWSHHGDGGVCQGETGGAHLSRRWVCSSACAYVRMHQHVRTYVCTYIGLTSSTVLLYTELTVPFCVTLGALQEVLLCTTTRCVRTCADQSSLVVGLPSSGHLSR